MIRFISLLRRNTSKQEPIELVQRGQPNSSGSSQTAINPTNEPTTSSRLISEDQASEITIDTRKVLTEEDCYEELGFNFSTRRKWVILTITFCVQVSMNFNTSLYSNALGGISAEFGVSLQAARVGAAIFLISYAFGCELWAPWSEGMLSTHRNLKSFSNHYQSSVGDPFSNSVSSSSTSGIFPSLSPRTSAPSSLLAPSVVCPLLVGLSPWA
jgi:hypothetical protein